MKDTRITHRTRILFFALSMLLTLLGAAKSHAETWHYADAYCRAYDHDKRSWLPWADSSYDYAGRYGHSIDCIELSCDWPVYYCVHVKGGNWLGVVSSDYSDYAGIKGKPIDAITIVTDPHLEQDGYVFHYGYQVHLKGRGWLPMVSSSNIYDSRNGYAGIFGREIDGFRWTIACSID